jgi:lipopolysaccharide/colanic/teichoic acid biosynthesis glycosyltransferase
MIKTMLLANRLAPELFPLTDRTCAALLRVAGKPLLIHAIESLGAAHLTDIIVVVSPFAEQVEKMLGDGTRWGMHFRYITARSHECPDGLVRRFDDQYSGGLLLVRGEILRTPMVAEFLARASSIETAAVAATIAGVPAGVVLIHTPRRLNSHQACTLVGLASDEGSQRESTAAIDFPDASLSRVESLPEFHRVNLGAAAGRFPGLIVPGRELMPGVIVGRKTRLPASAIKGRPVFVGSRCQIAADAELMGEVVVSSDVVVDRGAILRSAVIMPHTYIGELVEIADAIVAGDELIHVKTGAQTRVADSFLLASVHTQSLASMLRTGMDSLLAILLLILSIPLWPIALIASYATAAGHPLRRMTLLGNRRSTIRRVEFTTSQFSATPAILRYLPYLFAVAAGHLRLVGVEPLAPATANARTEEGEFVRDEAPAGLFGPVQLTLPADAPSEERLLMEAQYARTRSFAGDLRWLARSAISISRPLALKRHMIVEAPRGR